jgi:hypothetical protein
LLLWSQSIAREDSVVADDDDKPPNLKLVSENPNARADRQVAWAKEEVERTAALFAAAMHRTMAGSSTEATYLMHRISDFLDAMSKYRAEAGHGLTVAELEKALRLPQVEYESSNDEWRYRQWIREDGLEMIVKGALRLAAHKILGEEPHFGGKHSVEIILQGIKTLEDLKRPMPPARLKASAGADVDLGPPTEAPKRGLAGRRRSEGFSQGDLKELRKAIKAKDSKKIAELTAKIGKPIV